VLATLGIIHLLILGSGTFDFNLRDWDRLRFLRNAYHTVTGAGGSFGFFSPNVGNQVIIEFEVDGRERLRLHELVSAEVALRIGNMYRLFVQTYPNEDLKRSVAASLTSQIFRRYPKAEKVTMIVQVYKLPSLEAFAKGERPETKELYRITFTLTDQEASKRDPKK
jgi:hypothetical protein